MDPDLLIVGGGVGGSVLALAVARRGWSVTILEREPAPHAPARPEVLHASTFASFDTLGIGDRLRAEASIPLDGFEIWRGDRIVASISTSDLRRAGAAPRSVDPGCLRAIILDEAIATGHVDLRRGMAVETLILDRDRVVGVRGAADGTHAFEQHARFVVADDGGRSIVRNALGIPIALRPFPVEVASVRISRPAAVPDTRARIWIGRGGTRGPLAAGFVPLPGSDALMVAPFRSGDWDRAAAAPEMFWHDLEALTPLAATVRSAVRFPVDVSHFRLSFGHAARYSSHGAVLIGDAAHPMSPAGGQGANAAIADALALAGILGDITSKRISDEALLEFERQRRPANTRSMAFSERGSRIIRWSRWIPGSAGLAAGVLRLVGGSERLKAALLRQAATAFVSLPEHDD